MIFKIGEKIMNYSGTVSTEKSGTIRPKYTYSSSFLLLNPLRSFLFLNLPLLS